MGCLSDSARFFAVLGGIGRAGVGGGIRGYGIYIVSWWSMIASGAPRFALFERR